MCFRFTDRRTLMLTYFMRFPTDISKILEVYNSLNVLLGVLSNDAVNFLVVEVIYILKTKVRTLPSRNNFYVNLYLYLPYYKSKTIQVTP